MKLEELLNVFKQDGGLMRIEIPDGHVDGAVAALRQHLDRNVLSYAVKEIERDTRISPFKWVVHVEPIRYWNCRFQIAENAETMELRHFYAADYYAAKDWVENYMHPYAILSIEPEGGDHE